MLSTPIGKAIRLFIKQVSERVVRRDKRGKRAEREAQLADSLSSPKTAPTLLRKER